MMKWKKLRKALRLAGVLPDIIDFIMTVVDALESGELTPDEMGELAKKGTAVLEGIESV